MTLTMLLIWILLMLFIHAKTQVVYVGDGKDNVECGSERFPCRTIEYAMTHLPAQRGTLKLMTNSITYVMKGEIVFTQSVSFNMIGLMKGIKVYVQSKCAFRVFGQLVPFVNPVSVSMQISNVNFVVVKSCFLDLTTDRGQITSTVDIELDECSFESDGKLASELTPMIPVLVLGTRNRRSTFIMKITKCLFRRLNVTHLVECFASSLFKSLSFILRSSNFTENHILNKAVKVDNIYKISHVAVSMNNVRVTDNFIFTWLSLIVNKYNRESAECVVEVRNSLFNNNKFGHKFIDLFINYKGEWISSALTLNVFNTTFAFNSYVNEVDGSAISFSSSLVPSATIDISDITVRNVNATAWLSISYSLIQGYSGLCLTNSTFSRNILKNGIITIDDLACRISTLLPFFFNISMVVFLNNRVSAYNATEKGLISIQRSFKSLNTWEVLLNNVEANRNIGNVLSVINEGDFGQKERKAYIKVFVSRSVFSHNIGKIKGGAIHISTVQYSSSVSLQVDSSIFRENIAKSGGAIATNCLTRIHNSKFILNKAHTGGSLMFHNIPVAKPGGPCRSVVMNSVFVSDSPIIDINTDLDIENISILFKGQKLTPTEIFSYVSSSALLFVKDVHINCGIQNTASEKEGIKQTGNSTTLSYLCISCIPCSKGTYSLGNSTGKWNSTTSQLDVRNKKCEDCPRGGNCSAGFLQSRSNYWGFMNKDGTVNFVKCPRGQCATRTYNSCTEHRTGRLCSECKRNYSLSVLSSRCVDTSRCDATSWILFLFVVPLVIALGIIVKSEIKITVKKIIFFVKRKCTGVEAVYKNEKELFLIQKLKSIIYFYQIQKLLNIPNAETEPIWSSLQKELSIVFSVSLGQGIGISLNHCLPNSFNFIEKTIINIWFSTSPIFLCGIAFIIVHLMSQRWVANSQACKLMKLKLQTAIFEIRSLLYIPLAKGMFDLVKCVQITDRDGNQRLVLFGQGSVQCFTSGQITVLVLLCIWVIPYCLSVYAGTQFLKKGDIRYFYIVTFFPVSSFILPFLGVNPSTLQQPLNQVTANENMQLDATPELSLISDTSSRDSISRVSFDGMNENINTGGETDEEQLINRDDIEALEDDELRDEEPNIQITVPDHNVLKVLFDITQGPFKVEYWPSITILRGLLIAAVPTVFDHDHSQVLSIMLILQVYLVLLNNKTPYKDAILNKLEISLTFLLLFIGVVGIINLTYLSITDDNIVELLEQLDIVKFVVLLLPVPLLITFEVADRLIKKRNTSLIDEDGDNENKND